MYKSCGVAVLLLGCLLLLTEAKSVKKLARKTRGGHECERAFTGCQAPLLEWVNNDPSVFSDEESFSNFIDSKSLRQHCSSLTTIYNCGRTAAHSNSCSGVLSRDYYEVVDGIGEILNFVCVENLDAFEQHLDCLTDDDVIEDTSACIQRVNPNDIGPACNIEPFGQCSDSAIDGSSKCQPGAKGLARSILQKVVDLIPDCNVHRAAHALKHAQKFLHFYL